MATKKIKLCDYCLKDKKEKEALGSIQVWCGKYLDYDSYKDNFKDLDLCLDHLIFLIKKLLKDLDKEKQKDLL